MNNKRANPLVKYLEVQLGIRGFPSTKSLSLPRLFVDIQYSLGCLLITWLPITMSLRFMFVI